MAALAGCPTGTAGTSTSGDSTGATATTGTTTSASAATDATTTGQGPEPTTTGSLPGTTGDATSTTVGTTTDTTTSGGGGGFCQEACDDDDDCVVDGVDQGLVCQEGRCRPGDKPDKCNNDLFCQIVTVYAILAGFCESDAGCMGGWACAALDGFSQGACVPLADAMGECADDLNHEPITLPLLDGDEALVCVRKEVFCDPVGGFPMAYHCNKTPDPCRSGAECTLVPSQPICREDGACVCDDDVHCKDVVGRPHCVDGRCACTSDADCDAVTSADTCVDGVCGCSSAAVCPAMTYHDGTTIVCEPL